MDSQDAVPVEVREGNVPGAGNADDVKVPPPENSASAPKAPESDPKTADRKDTVKKSAKEKSAKKHCKNKKKSKKKRSASEDSENSDSDQESSSSPSSSSSSSSDSDSDSESDKKKRATKKRHDIQKSKKKPKSKKQKKPAKGHVNAADSSSDSESDSSDLESSDDEGDDVEQQTSQQQQQQELTRLMQQMQQQLERHNLNFLNGSAPSGGFNGGMNGGLNGSLGGGLNGGLIPADNIRLPPPGGPAGGRSRRAVLPSQSRSLSLGGLDQGLVIDMKGQQQQLPPKQKRKSSRPEYKRVDHVWDNTIHAYKLQDTAETTTDAQYEEYIFHVRRSFDWEGKYKHTQVDIKSKLLRECLQEIMGNIKGVSLVEETPKLDPNMLFLYLNDLTKHLKNLKKTKISGSDKHSRKKEQKRLAIKRSHLKVLIRYINKDYDAVKSSLYPMLQNGLITFDLLWALWKPNTLAFTSTYGSLDEPRVFKVEVAEKHCSIMRGDYYLIDGKYFEYDGKQFGFGSQTEEVGEFRGARKITSLPVYPLQYHKNEAQIRKDLIARGKKFVALSGVHYRAHQGMAYYKKKRSIIKVNINGRIMVDPNIHRRINPNYPISHVRPKDHDILSDDEDSNEDDVCCVGSWSDSEGGNGRSLEKVEKVKFVTKAIKDEKGKVKLVRLPKMLVDGEKKPEKLDKAEQKGSEDAAAAAAASEEGDNATDETEEDEKAEKKPPEFSDEEYLIASPVVLGFAFAEKLWLEFTVSGVKDIQWNETAYDSLVLEPKTKDIVKALVESHKYHAAESIDDVIQGKGKGLVAVLHGPPGTGKTLTAEGISELLKCPLYMVSAGELGTDSRYLESELQKILDICHAWGAILLLDEADVFLEKRNMHDIHRNALVSIFLRQLEYFQGILFLTTNRVETFDDAFQSRIHIALRYDSLTHAAKKAIFKIFIERVRVLEKLDLMPFTEEDYNALARHELNGRQIKNTVGTAQALAVNKREPLAMNHIRQVLDVQMSFDRDLKGGTGYQDAMRSYF